MSCPSKIHRKEQHESNPKREVSVHRRRNQWRCFQHYRIEASYHHNPLECPPNEPDGWPRREPVADEKSNPQPINIDSSCGSNFVTERELHIAVARRTIKSLSPPLRMSLSSSV